MDSHRFLPEGSSAVPGLFLSSISVISARIVSLQLTISFSFPPRVNIFVYRAVYSASTLTRSAVSKTSKGRMVIFSVKNFVRVFNNCATKTKQNVYKYKLYRWIFVPDCFSGRTKLNVEPLPGSLCAMIDPLCFSSIFLQIERPTPVPSNS